MVAMRDGVRLSTYLYIAEGTGPWPVLYEQRYADLRWCVKSLARMAAAEAMSWPRRISEGPSYRKGPGSATATSVGGPSRTATTPSSGSRSSRGRPGKSSTFGGSQAGFAQNFLAVTRSPHLTCQYMIDTGLSLFHEGYRIGGATRPERFKTMDAVCRNPEDNPTAPQRVVRSPQLPTRIGPRRIVRAISTCDERPLFYRGKLVRLHVCRLRRGSFIGRQHRGGPNSQGGSNS